MHIGFHGSGPKCEGYVPVPGNPKPDRFKIIRVEEHRGNLVALIHYPDAKNYEGKKVMLYLDATEKQLREQTEIDPHFTESGFRPFARFEPTKAGWIVAVNTANAYPGPHSPRTMLSKMRKAPVKEE